jgi:hypothetical protein
MLSFQESLCRWAGGRLIEVYPAAITYPVGGALSEHEHAIHVAPPKANCSPRSAGWGNTPPRISPCDLLDCHWGFSLHSSLSHRVKVVCRQSKSHVFIYRSCVIDHSLAYNLTSDWVCHSLDFKTQPWLGRNREILAWSTADWATLVFTYRLLHWVAGSPMADMSRMVYCAFMIHSYKLANVMRLVNRKDLRVHEAGL